MHVDGCREALMNHVRTSLFLGMCVITSICFFLQAIVLILFRYLQASISLAIKKGDPTADSLAYILSICLPTDDMTEDKCLRPVTASTAASAAPSFVSSKPPAPPPTSTTQTLEQAAATLGAVGQPSFMPGNVSQSNISADGAPVDGMYRRAPAAATPINNSARVDQPASVIPSNRSSVISMSAVQRQGSSHTAPGTPYLFT